MEKFDLIERYFENSLDAKERLVFNDLLQNDAEFKEEFVFQRDLKEAIAANQREDVKKTLEHIESSVGNNKLFQLIPRKWMAVATIAVLFSLGIWSIKSNYYPSNDAIYADHFEPCRNHIQPVVRSEGATSIEYRAFVAYEAKNYHKAINLFNSSENAHLTYTNFYKGLSYLGLGKTNEAIELLTPIANTMEFEGQKPNWSERADWFIALAHIKNENNSEAEKALNKIVNHPTHTFKKEEAQLILNYIN